MEFIFGVVRSHEPQTRIVLSQSGASAFTLVPVFFFNQVGEVFLPCILNILDYQNVENLGSRQVSRTANPNSGFAKVVC